MSRKAGINDLADLSEPFLDEAQKQLLQRFAGEALPELIADIPVAKTFVVIGKIFSSAKQYHRTKMMLSFINALENGTKSMQVFEQLPEEDQNDIRSLVVAQLDLHADERQAEATALIVDAYLWKKVDRLTFLGVLSELKNTNPLLYYFNVDSIGVTKEENEAVVAVGPTYLLPSAFGHNTVAGVGLWDSTGEYKYVVTKLGQAFFEYVYDPMFQKYTM